MTQHVARALLALGAVLATTAVGLGPARLVPEPRTVVRRSVPRQPAT